MYSTCALEMKHVTFCFYFNFLEYIIVLYFDKTSVFALPLLYFSKNRFNKNLLFLIKRWQEGTPKWPLIAQRNTQILVIDTFLTVRSFNILILSSCFEFLLWLFAHPVCATSITVLDVAVISGRQIMKVSGYKSETSLKSYSHFIINTGEVFVE